MLRSATSRRRFVTLATVALLAGCQVVPKAPPQAPPPPEQPNANRLPTDQQRHRVALLVPLGGANGAVGQSLANAATMALLDTTQPTEEVAAAALLTA